MVLAPRERRLLVGVLALAWAAFSLPLLADELPYYRDVLRTDWPVRVFIGASLRAGHLPQWYPWEGLGLQFIGNAEGLFRPLSLLYLLPGSVLSLMKLEQSLCWALGLAGFALFARRLQLAAPAAALGAIAFAFCGYALSLNSNLPYLYPYHLLPWVLWAGHGALTSERRWAWAALCAVGWSQVVLGGDPLGALFAGVGLLVIALTERKWRQAGPLAVSIPLTAALCLPWLLPAMALFQESTRRDWAPDSSTLALHLSRVPELWLGGVWADPDLETGLKRILDLSELWAASLFLGGTVLVLALVGAGLRERRGLIWSGVGLVFYWLALGQAGGLHTVARTVFPLFNFFRYPEKFASFGGLSLCIAAAVGADAAVRAKPDAWRWAGRGALGGLGALTVAVLLLLWASPESFNLKTSAGLLPPWGLGAVVTLALAASSLWALRNGHRHHLLVWLAPVLVFAELQVAGLNALPMLPSATIEGVPQFCRVAHANGAAYGQERVSTEVTKFPRHDSVLDAASWVTATRNLIEPDINALCELEDLATPNLSGTPGRWWRAVNGLPWPRLAHLFNAPLAITNEGKEAPGTVLDAGGGFALVRRPVAALPRVYDAQARWVPDADAAFAELRTVDDGVVLLEGAPLATGSTKGTVALTRYEPNHVELTAQLAEPRVVVLNDLWAPGWTATLDGAPVEVRRANLVVRGVVVPAGSHTVHFDFETPGLNTGLAAGGLTLLLCAALALWDLRRAASTR